MKVRLASASERLLIVGESGEASLLAALRHATELTGVESGADPAFWADTLWVRSYRLAACVAHHTSIKRVAIDVSLTDEPIEIIDSRNRRPPIFSVVDELERQFGRVYSAAGGLPEAFASSGPRSARLSSLFRRGVEIVFAGMLLVLAIPVLLVTSIMYRLVFGPTQFLHRQHMVGERGRSLTLLEYAPRPESLRSGSRLESLAASLGRNLRRMHFNGIPSLIKVLNGEMALVGPTPVTRELFDGLATSSSLFEARVLVRPGIVSLARVRLRSVSSEYDLNRALEYDLFYIKHRSRWLDARILTRAFQIVALDVFATLWRILTSAVVLSGRAARSRLQGSRAGGSALVSPPMPLGADGSPLELTPALVIGGGAGGTLLIRELRRNRTIGLWPVAVVDDRVELAGTKIHGVPVLGTTESLGAIVARERIGAVVIAIPSAAPAIISQLERLARATNVSVFSMPPIGQILKGAEPTALISVPVRDLLGRPMVESNPLRARHFLAGKRVLVTGAVGSIGREVVFEALRGNPAVIFGLDINESDLYDLQQELARRNLATEFVPIVGSVCDTDLVISLMQRIQPDVVFHAAAYKHVPLMEDYPREAVRTNILGTWTIGNAAAQVGVERFVLVSTDKAVKPTSVMGASKRIAELLVQELGQTTKLSTCAVRFGNVLGSRGSVIPLFERQIAAGGPVTITDPRMMRYFMTIPEAAGLIIEAGAFGDGGVVYMLDMGEPVRIVDLANRLIELKGLRPGVDIEIEFTGLRPGEKLFEELSLDFEQARPTPHRKIRILDEGNVRNSGFAESILEQLSGVIESDDPGEIRRFLLRAVREVDAFEPMSAAIPASAELVESVRSSAHEVMR